MAGAAEIARLLTQGTAPLSGDQDNALHTGIVRSWDRFTGVNSIEINGVLLPNLDSLQSGIGNSYTVGDVVVVQRKQTKYYILGKVASPLGSAGSAPAFQTSNIAYSALPSTGGSWTTFSPTPLPGPPTVTTYVGSSRTALVIWQCKMTTSNSRAWVGFSVSGASSIPLAAFTGMDVSAGNDCFGGAIRNYDTCTGSYLMGPGAGLNKGQNTFSLGYRVDLFGAGTGADIAQLGLTVIPL